MRRHVSALTVGHLQEALKFYSLYSLHFNLYGGNSTADWNYYYVD